MAPILVASGFISRAFVEIAKVYPRGQMSQLTKQHKTLNVFFTRDIIRMRHTAYTQRAKNNNNTSNNNK